MKPILTLALALTALLTGCALTASAPPRTVYDLGPAPAAPATGTPVPWRIADVTASPSASSDGIAYRLAFQQAQRLEFYRDSVWAAPPAALLTQRLREQIVAPPACTARGPALVTVHLDTFEQVFGSPSQAQVVLRLHATLWRAEGGTALAQQHWRLEQPSDSADAAGAVRGLAQAVDAWLPQFAHWLAASACR